MALTQERLEEIRKEPTSATDEDLHALKIIILSAQNTVDSHQLAYHAIVGENYEPFGPR